MSNGAGQGKSGATSDEGSQQKGGRGPNIGSVRNRGEARAVKTAPWRFTKSDLLDVAPGTLDAAAILNAVNETLLTVVEKELEKATEKLGAVLADKETETDLISAFRGELMRRILPQFTEAVRNGVLESIRMRQMHLAQLAVLHRQALDARSIQVVVTRLDHEVAKAGLQIVSDIGDQSLFNVMEDEPGVIKRGPVTLELMAPAYVDKESGKLVERGWLRAVGEDPFPRKSPDRSPMKPGAKRRSKHAKADNKRSEKEVPARQEPKKPHRGQDPEKQRNKGSGRRNGGAPPRPGGSEGQRMNQRGTR
ncbi:hypothetical protein ACFWOL_06060 [Streptomyces sp. NPDC058442]|uniref:hypothetical protein n=1 Tax=Streptomyces sp. NPDC058442 TaxID=3346503 RepID=UPI00366A418B